MDNKTTAFLDGRYSNMTKKPKLHQWFHNFLIYFAMWVFGAFAILYGIKTIYEAEMNGYHGAEFVMVIIVNVLLIGVGLVTFKTRFDLAGFRSIALKELPGVCIAGAVLCLSNLWIEDMVGDDLNRRLLPAAFILICWAFVLYRYYHERDYLFGD